MESNMSRYHRRRRPRFLAFDRQPRIPSGPRPKTRSGQWLEKAMRNERSFWQGSALT